MNVFILTINFPYLPGEEFLEEEIAYWSRYKDISVTLLPFNTTSSGLRTVPANINVKAIFKQYNKRQIWYILQACFSSIFWYELFKYNPKKFSIKTLMTAIGTLSYALFIKDCLIKENIPKNSLLYSYWFDICSYGMCLFKKIRPDIKIVSRAHRFDVYKELRIAHYMPLKSFLANDFDMIAAISSEGKNYLINNYNIRSDKLKVFYLGVSKKTHLNIFPDHLHILTCSYITSVKQLPLLIDALALLDVGLLWTHIGDGPLMTETVLYAEKKLRDKTNIRFEFLGKMINESVLEYYAAHKISCFINCSKSEGVPVSIMEAMSFGIPVIAPDIGGISEQVTSETGILLPAKFSAEQMAQAISQITAFHNTATQEKILMHWGRSFSSDKNYTQFIQDLITIHNRDA